MSGSLVLQRVVLLTDPALECDCGAYWLARVLRERRVPLVFEPRCADGAPLRNVSLRALRCALGAARCAPGCGCALEPHCGGAVARCNASLAPGALGALRARLAPLPLRELRMPRAALRALPDELPAELQVRRCRRGHHTNSTHTLFDIMHFMYVFCVLFTSYRIISLFMFFCACSSWTWRIT